MNTSQLEIAKNFSKINGTSFVGIKGYESKTSGETANHVVNVGFSYENAIEKDLNKLNNLTAKDIENLVFETGIDVNTVLTAKNEMINSFIKNRNKETQSKQSEAQQETYLSIAPGIRLHKETGQIYIYALHVSKQVIVKGEHKKVNSREKTLAKKAIQKYLDMSTSKFRNFIVSKDHLAKVKSLGEELIVE